MDIQIDVAKGADLAEYLDHIGWKGIVQPWLEKQKATYQNLLVEVVLSNKPIETSGGQLLTAERLAAYIEGINHLEALFKTINRRRDSALAELQDSNLFDFEEE